MVGTPKLEERREGVCFGGFRQRNEGKSVEASSWGLYARYNSSLWLSCNGGKPQPHLIYMNILELSLKQCAAAFILIVYIFCIATKTFHKLADSALNQLLQNQMKMIRI